MRGMDLFFAVNDVRDSYIAEADFCEEKEKKIWRICRKGIAVAAVVLVVFLGNKMFFHHGDFKYRIVKISSVFQPQDEVMKTRKGQAWEELPPNNRYPQLCMRGVVYGTRMEECNEVVLGRFLGKFSVSGREYVRVGVLLYFDVEIFHETKVDVYEVVSEEQNNTVVVRFEKDGECYLYDRIYR